MAPCSLETGGRRLDQRRWAFQRCLPYLVGVAVTQAVHHTLQVPRLPPECREPGAEPLGSTPILVISWLYNPAVMSAHGRCAEKEGAV